MFLECTQKLADVLKIQLTAISPLRREPLYEWHANLFMFNRRKGVIMMNNQTRYSVVMYGLKAEQFKKFDQFALAAIERAFLAEGFSEKVVAQYIENCREVVFTKTHDRSVISQMNDMLLIASYWTEDYLSATELCVVNLSKRLGEVPVGSLKYAYPIDLLRQAMGDIENKET
jgi:hypothetical protein